MALTNPNEICMARKVEDAVKTRDFAAFQKLIYADLSRIYLDYGNEPKELLGYLSESYYHAYEERSDPNNILRLMIMSVLWILLIDFQYGIHIHLGTYSITFDETPLPPRESDVRALPAKYEAHMQSYDCARHAPRHHLGGRLSLCLKGVYLGYVGKGVGAAVPRVSDRAGAGVGADPVHTVPAVGALVCFALIDVRLATVARVSHHALARIRIDTVRAGAAIVAGGVSAVINVVAAVFVIPAGLALAGEPVVSIYALARIARIGVVKMSCVLGSGVGCSRGLFFLSFLCSRVR